MSDVFGRSQSLRTKDPLKVALIGFPFYDPNFPSYPLMSLAGSIRAHCPWAEPVVLDLDYLFQPDRTLGGLLRPGIHPPCFDLGAISQRWLDGSSATPEFSELVDFFAEFLVALDCDVLAASVVLSSWPFAIPVLKEFGRQRPDCPVILGGHQVSLWLELCREQALPGLLASLQSVADWGVIGEGEISLVALLQHLRGVNSLDQPPSGTVFLGAERAAFGPPRTEWPPLDQIPPPDFGCVVPPPDREPNRVFEFLSMELSRGCTYKCSFCSDSGYFHGYRVKSLERLRAEISSTRPLNYSGLYDFIGSILPLNHPSTPGIVETIKAMSPAITWGTYIHLAGLTREWAHRLHDAGCRIVSIGVETASDQQLLRMSKSRRGVDIEASCAWLREAGIITELSFNFGFPGESFDSASQTIALIERLRDHVRMKVFDFMPAVFSPFATQSSVLEESFSGEPTPLSIVFGPHLYYHPPLYCDPEVYAFARNRLTTLGLGAEFCLERRPRGNCMAALVGAPL